VDIRYKADGLISLEELSESTFSSPGDVVKLGDEINVYIQTLENKEGYIVLSKKRADAELRWKITYDAFKNKSILDGKVIQVLKGGLSIDCNGLRGFIPASQVVKKGKQSLEGFKNRTLPVKIIEINRRQGKVVFSHRLAAGERDRLKSEQLIEELAVGQVRHGTVSSLKDFGAFVDLGGMDGRRAAGVALRMSFPGRR